MLQVEKLTYEEITKDKARKYHELAIESQSPITKLAHWSTAIVLDPDPVYYYMRAETLSYMADFEGAIRNFREFERICKSKFVMVRYSYTLYVYGECLLDQFRWSEV
jgi:hypothetical protein